MRLMTLGSLTIACWILAPGQSAEAQRGRGGYGGGMSRQSSYSSSSSHSTGAMGPYGGSSTHNETRESSTNSNGGQYKSGTTSGSYDTQRGGTVNYGAAGKEGTGAGGSSAGKGVYGVSGTSAGGKSYSDYGKVGGVSGPGGNSATTHSNAYGASGPNGAVAGGSRSSTAYGQNGAAAGGSRYGAAYGENGAAAGGSRYGAYGQGGYAAGGQGYGGAHTYGTAYVPSSALAYQGTNVRGAFAGSNYGSPAFYGSQPGAWAAGGGAMAATASPAGWGAVASATGYPAAAGYSDFGGNVVSQPNAVYVNGDPVGTPQQYAQQAGQIAAVGYAAPDPNSAWQHLGVYALAQQDQNAPPADLFQLAINKQGVIRGNYHNAQTNKTEQVSGSVDPKTLRAAWSVGQQKAPIYEAGIANLTNDQTTMLIHDASGRSTQATLVKLQPDDGANPASGTGQPPQR